VGLELFGSAQLGHHVVEGSGDLIELEEGGAGQIEAGLALARGDGLGLGGHFPQGGAEASGDQQRHQDGHR